ncbi:hypothetical protein [Bosea sp. RAC05]|jgi:hypothetical protein|uniref:hypothetical protein n=1 Tax=Bosea sp. RAC05 TaxID=1842539 RepID=UPI0014960536|nr:hypothetical protein [Bosea sp. RAC05]
MMQLLIEEMRVRLRKLERGEIDSSAAALSEADVQRWSASFTAGDVDELFRRIADALARGFHRGEIEFELGDFIANGLHWPMVDRASEGVPVHPLLWDVFLAFDAGEFSSCGEDPIEAKTAPMIAEIVARLDAQAPSAA